MFKNIVNNRIIILFLFMLVFVAVHTILKGSYLPTTDTKDIWFYSGFWVGSDVVLVTVYRAILYIA